MEFRVSSMSPYWAGFGLLSFLVRKPISKRSPRSLNKISKIQSVWKMRIFSYLPMYFVSIPSSLFLPSSIGSSVAGADVCNYLKVLAKIILF
jgi:hypothetical protein